MKSYTGHGKWLFVVGITLILAGCATSGEKYNTTAHWKEAVPLHDGSELMIERVLKKNPRGNRELFQGDPLAQVITTFTSPATGKKIEWVSDFTCYPDENDLTLLALDIIDNVPYIATAVSDCPGMYIWGRPNPPQVFFKHGGATWQRISVADFPKEISIPNVMVNVGNFRGLAELFSRGEVIDKAIILKRNERLRNERYNHILREPITTGLVSFSICEETFSVGEGKWKSLKPYRQSGSLQSCLKLCVIYRVETQYCPCNKLFNQETSL